MKEGIVVGCLLKVVAMASDDEGFTLSVTSKLREFTALGYPSHVLNGAIGRAFARTRDERLLRARLCSQWGGNQPHMRHVNQKEKTYSQSQSEHRPKAGAVD